MSRTAPRCEYCHEQKPVRVWKQTDELVCYDCRLEMLEVEFQGEHYE